MENKTEINVQPEEETVWLTQEQMGNCKSFGKNKNEQNITLK